MKKVTNIVMSALALTASCTGMLTANVLADTSSSAQADLLHTEVNAYGGWMSLMQVEPGKNQIVFMPGDGDGSWGTMRVVFAQENYEAGVTELEADAGLERLGIEEDGRFVVLYDEDTRRQAFVPLWSPVIKNNGLVKNKTDRLYYAVQHGHPVYGEDGEVSWEDVWWERGKIDYRSCVHASVYNQSNTLCNQKFDASGTKVSYVASDNVSGAEKVVPAGEWIMTWEEEWRQIREEKLNSLQAKLETLQWNVENFEDIIVGAEEDLDKIEATLNGDGEADLASRTENLREILQKMQDLMAKYDIDGMKSELETLRAELKDLREKFAKLEAEKATLKAEKTVLEEEKMSLEGEKSTLEEEKSALEGEKTILEESKAALEVEKQKVTEDNEKLRAEVVKLQEKLAFVESTEGTENDKEDNTENSAGNEDASKGNVTQEDLGAAEIVQERRIASTIEVVTREGETNMNDTTSVIADDQNAVGNGEANESTRADEDNDNIEVPLLGEVETGTNFWWILISVLIFAGAMGITVRSLRRK